MEVHTGAGCHCGWDVLSFSSAPSLLLCRGGLWRKCPVWLPPWWLCRWVLRAVLSELLLLPSDPGIPGLTPVMPCYPAGFLVVTGYGPVGVSFFFRAIEPRVTSFSLWLLPKSFSFSLLKAVRRLGRREMSETSELWQIKLVLEFFSSRSHQERLQTHPKRGLFMNSEFLPVVKCSIDNTLDQWLQGNKSLCALCFLDDTGTRLFCSNMFSLESKTNLRRSQNACGFNVSR